MNILITGGAGFIGSHLTDALLKKEHIITIIDNFSTGSRVNLKHHEGDKNLTVIEADVNKSIEDIKELQNKKFDYIFHLAAAVGVKVVVEQPLLSLKTNLKGTENILDFADKNKTPIMLASTSEVYGKSTNFPFTEDQDITLGPTIINRWGYAASKMIDEFLGMAYHRQKDLQVTIVRFFNTVGPRQSSQFGMVIPNFIKQALNNQDITVYGDGKQSRCFGHVLDVIEAIIVLMETGKAVGEVVNIGNSEEVTINELAERIIKKTKSKSKVKLTPYDSVFKQKNSFEDMTRRVPNLEKIKKLIGYVPKRNLDTILEDTINEMTK